jgi:hypothetical protein
MPLAGETVQAGKQPGERVGTAIVTSSSGAITTTETVVATVVFPAVAGRIYRIVADIGFAVSVVTDRNLCTIREDSVSGTVKNQRNIGAPTTTSPWSYHIEAEYTADATEDKTVVLTLQRSTGTGNIVLAAGASQPSYLYADYIRES